MAYEFVRADFDDHYGINPFGFNHQLQHSPLFTEARLTALAAHYDGHPDSYVAGSAAAPGAIFFSVPSNPFGTVEALRRLDDTPLRILLKRPEDHDPDFRVLRDHLYAQIVEMRPELKDQKLVRFETAIFISSAATTTPFHFDPEVNFFAQIVGEKEYHVYEPVSVSTVELDAFYARQVVAIGQIPLETRATAYEHVFQLTPGRAFHQPLNAPHWVRTGAGRSVSYALVFETEAMRAQGRVRAFNHYARKLGFNLAPSTPYDAVKAALVTAALPIKRRFGGVYRKFRPHPVV